VTARLEDRLQEIVQLSLGSAPEAMLGKALDVCIEMSGAQGGAILAEEGPYLQFLFADLPELIGMRVPFDSIAGVSVRKNAVVYTYAPADARHFRGVDAQTRAATRYLLSIPIPPVLLAAGAARQASASGALQLLFDRDLMPGTDAARSAREFAIAAFKEQDLYRARLQDVFWALPLLAFGIEVLRLRRTSYQAVHELKNKLIAGQSWVGCLREDLRRRAPNLLDDPTVREDLALCESSAREGATLAKTYLQLASIYTPSFAPVDINEVIRLAAAEIRAFAAECGVTGLRVVLELDGSIGARDLDGGQLKMAFFNLCKNAVEAMLERGVARPALALTTTVSGDRVLVEIADNGPGMRPEIADKLFVAFKSRKPGGAGLGLVITKKIVDVHGGAIRCRTGPEGTRFQIEV
jgi:signal transduction histidine kinase